MAKYLDIFTDYGFKKIFGEEASKDTLIDFLNSLLPVHAHIRDLTFKNTEQLGEKYDDRKAVYDIYCENERGEHFIVELQKAKQDYFIERTIYYATFPISKQAVKGKWDYNLKAVYCIGILDFTFSDYTHEHEKREVVHTHVIKNQHNKPVYDKLSFTYLEMPNFNMTENELKTQLDKWLFFIKNLENFDAIPEIFKNEVVFAEAIKKAEIAKMSEEDRAKYDESLKIYRDYLATTESAERAGIKKGIEIGEMKGIEIGEMKKAFEMALKCIKKGMPLTDIADLTGLSEDEIKLMKLRQ